MHIRVLLSKYRAYTECGACHGTRLKPDALLWKLDGRSIHELMLLPVSRVNGFFQSLSIDDEAAELVLREIRTRLGYLCEVGLGYLTLDRQSRTLSGGEVQRINLTTAVGTSLVNPLFVLDEPSIGLHPRDMGRVIGVMQRLRDAGNSLVVVEHDPQIMFAADRILDMGPGPGERGGEIVFFGAPEKLKAEASLTGEYLSGRRQAAHARNEAPASELLQLLGAAEHDVKNLDVRIPLGRLVCVSGVSGSGKSTLLQDVLHPALLRAKGKPTEAPGAYRELKGAELVSEAVLVDQSPIGKTTRSNPASYVGAFDCIRDLFSRTDISKERRYTAGTFSFNSGNGRCPSCGGQAQRLKLAGHLAETKMGSDPILFLFDEPTTGLHFDDVAKLLRAFRQLLQAGHSLVVIEHNLDVIRSSDWILDLGPEGGDAGGELVCEGTPAQVMAHPSSPTGKALRDYEKAFTRPVEQKESGSVPVLSNAIRIHNAREHNLKSIDVEIPRGRFTVVTGVSGSGKSTLAFDILFAEGQRRYLESLNAYARQFVQAASRPDVDAIFGIPPTVAIEQRTSRGGRKSTVGTLTEVHHFLRLLFVKLGTQYCPDCEVPIEPQSEEAIAARILREYRGETLVMLAPLVVNRKGVYTELARWAAAKGYTQLRVDGKLLPVHPFPRIDRFKEHSIELPVGYVKVSARGEKELRERLAKALEFGKGVVHVLTGRQVEVFSTKRACRSCGRSFPELDPRLFFYNSKHGWGAGRYGTRLKIDDVQWEEERARTGAEDNVLDSWIEWLEINQACPQCEGRRLNPEALAVLWRGKKNFDYRAPPPSPPQNVFVEREKHSL